MFALIIGINKYKDWPLYGAVADADAVLDYLQNHLGVPTSRIRILRDSEATRGAIIREIIALSVKDDKIIEKGDPILIYFAGHGESADTPDSEVWKVGSTGKIELLVPYDRDSSTLGIPDRTLAALLSHIAIKKGDNIVRQTSICCEFIYKLTTRQTVILDCCHSSSLTRNKNQKVLDPSYKARAIDIGGKVPPDLDKEIWSVFESSDERASNFQLESGFVRGLRSHLLLAACHSRHLAYERMGRGVFTVALLKILMDIGINKLTYASLFDRWMPPLSSG